MIKVFDSVGIVIVSLENIQQQVCDMFNTYAFKEYKLTQKKMAINKTKYVVAMRGDAVVGVAGMHQIDDDYTIFKHLVVLPIWRRKGIATALFKARVAEVKTRYIKSTIRSDNDPSLKYAKDLGYVIREMEQKDGYKLYTLIYDTRRTADE